MKVWEQKFRRFSSANHHENCFYNVSASFYMDNSAKFGAFSFIGRQYFIKTNTNQNMVIYHNEQCWSVVIEKFGLLLQHERNAEAQMQFSSNSNTFLTSKLSPVEPSTVRGSSTDSCMVLVCYNRAQWGIFDSWHMQIWSKHTWAIKASMDWFQFWTYRLNWDIPIVIIMKWSINYDNLRAKMYPKSTHNTNPECFFCFVFCACHSRNNTFHETVKYPYIQSSLLGFFRIQKRAYHACSMLAFAWPHLKAIVFDY